jgi:O-antigen/teichoic acid export membrane protein
LFTPIITIPFLTRVIGPTGLGINIFTESIVSWFILFAMLGIRTYGSKEIAKMNNNRDERSKFFCELVFFQFISFLLMIILYYIIFSSLNTNYKLFYLVKGLIIFSTAFDITWLYSGLENFKQITFRNLFVKILNIVLIITLLKTSNDLLLMMIINLFTTFLGFIIMWFSIKKYVDFIKVKVKGVLSHWKAIFQFFVPQLSMGIYSSLDQTMIGIFSPNVADVGFYGQAQKFVKMFMFVNTSLSTVMMPRIVSLRAEDKEDLAKKYIISSFNMSLYLGIGMMIGLSSIAMFFVPWFMGNDFYDVGPLMIIISPIILFISLTTVLGSQYLIPFEKIKFYSKSVTIGCIINVVLNFILIPFFGAIGASIASVCAEMSVFLIQFKLSRNDIKFTEVKKNLFQFAFSGALMGIVVVLIGFNFKLCILTNLIQIIAGIFVYISVLFLFGNKVQFEVFKEFKNIFKKVMSR